MENADYLKNLDILLKFFYNYRDSLTINPNDIMALLHYSFSDRELLRYIEKLIKDDYISSVEKVNVFNSMFDKYQITQNGIIFYENSSYKKEFEDKKIDRKFNEKISSVESSYWIKKDKDKYFYDGNLLEIKNPKANYFIIFDAVYHIAKNGGDVEYEKIIECCKKRNLPKTTRKKIQKALTGRSADFFKHVKGIDRILYGGVSLFEASPNGNFLTFNNTKN